MLVWNDRDKLCTVLQFGFFSLHGSSGLHSEGFGRRMNSLLEILKNLYFSSWFKDQSPPHEKTKKAGWFEDLAGDPQNLKFADYTDIWIPDKLITGKNVGRSIPLQVDPSVISIISSLNYSFLVLEMIHQQKFANTSIVTLIIYFTYT